MLNNQIDLLTDASAQRFDINEGELTLFNQVFLARDSKAIFSLLREQTPWRADVIRIAGREVLIPRLQAWYGDADAKYAYSGLSLSPLPWSRCLLRIKDVVERLSGASFNSVLLNLYRDGRDSIGWHSDDEPELGAEPVIASLSFGATRVFSLRQKKPGVQKLKMALPSGSLLLMSGRLQQCWQHQLPKTQIPVGERINLTFRTIQR